MDETISKLKAWVTENYVQCTTGWTAQRSMGNYDDCFDDGQGSARSWAAYEVGYMLGMKLEEPDEPKYE